MPNAHILVDADACPVREEIVKVARRRRIPVTLVANQGFRPLADRLPDGRPLVSGVVVSDAFDAADDEIVRRAEAFVASGTCPVVVTADIALAHRVLAGIEPRRSVLALAPDGREWTDANIGGAMATRAVMADLRSGLDGMTGAFGGPKPFSKADRSQFLQTLDRLLARP